MDVNMVQNNAKQLAVHTDDVWCPGFASVHQLTWIYLAYTLW
jgi:hypothetical protein